MGVQVRRMVGMVFLGWLATAVPDAWKVSAEDLQSGRRVEVSRDAWISAFPSEQAGNNGAASRLKLKGIQEFFLIDFDPASLAEMVCERAELHVKIAGDESLGRVTVSSIMAPWHEGSGTNYAVTEEGSSFLWQAGTDVPWASDSPDITGVVLGNGGSQWGFADATSPDRDGWQTIAIDPAVVQARLEGFSHGFFVIDDVGSEYTRQGNHIEYRLFPNRFLYSRESSRSRAPYFKLWLRPRKPGDPAYQPPPVHKLEPVNPAVLPDLPTSVAGRTTRLRPAADTPAVGTVPIRHPDGRRLSDNRLYAARGEAIGFLVPWSAGIIRVVSPDDVEVHVYRTPLIDGKIDPLVPVTSKQPLPPDASTLEGDAYIELYVHPHAAGGPRRLELTDGQQRVTIDLQVWNFALPDRLSFIPQMNCYGLPDNEIDFYRLAHDHRTTLNRLRYSWTGKVAADAVPTLDAARGWDWSAWDQKFGPLLDGSAFADLRRGGVPLEAMYLPINENWPMDHEAAFRGGYWVESAYPDQYWETFRDAVARFTTHFAERGYHHTMFEFYLNNKVYFKANRDNRWDACSAPWIFDEPTHTQDFWALRRFGREFWLGVHAAGQQQALPWMTYRLDISRPQWQRELLDDVSNVEVVSGELRRYRQRVIERSRRLNHLVYMYGSSGPVTDRVVMPAAWCVETWALGGDGVVPWQTIGTKQSWTKPDDLSLFYPTAGKPVPSIRLKSFRQGQQLVEYLTIYSQLSGNTRAEVGEAVLTDPGLKGVMRKRSEEDAGTTNFGEATAGALARLRLSLGHWLDQQSPPDRVQWHQPFPPAKPAVPVESRRVVQ